MRGESENVDPPPNSESAEGESDTNALSRFMSHHFYFSQKKTPGLEVIALNSIAQFNFHWEGKGKLHELLTFESKEMRVEIVEDFPEPPFQIMVEEEIIQVGSVEITPPIGRYLKLKRGVDGSKAVAHAKGIEVTIRKTVNQLHWVVDKGAKGADGLHVQSVRPLTRFKVPMEFADPKFKEPSIPKI